MKKGYQREIRREPELGKDGLSDLTSLKDAYIPGILYNSKYTEHGKAQYKPLVLNSCYN